MVRASGALVLLLVAGCGAATSGTDLQVAGSSALTWGDGDYGVVLAHGASFDAASWEEQATAMAEQGATVVAVEDIAPEAISGAVHQLQEDGIEDVVLLAGSAHAQGIFNSDHAAEATTLLLERLARYADQ